jgi:hypothetical protein
VRAEFFHAGEHTERGKKEEAKSLLRNFVITHKFGFPLFSF